MLYKFIIAQTVVFFKGKGESFVLYWKQKILWKTPM